MNKEINTGRQCKVLKHQLRRHGHMKIETLKKQNKHTIPSHINKHQCFPVAAAITFGKQSKV